MKFPAAVLAIGLPVSSFAHNHFEAIVARQASSSGVAGTTTGAVTQTSFSFSLLSTNPTAVPLASIVSGASVAPTRPLASTPAAGATPSISGAPPLPDPNSLIISSYPPLDKTPPTDSPEVRAWIEEVANSGISIPGFNVTVPGGCPTNLEAVADASRCWWFCGGCTRDTDIVDCPDKLTWGLTFDDGPSPYTSDLMHYLDEQNVKATFFVVGSRVISYPSILQAEYLAGHQIAVHTWSHSSLTTLSNEGVIAELGWTRKAIKDVLGVSPNMMRPPFGDMDDRVRAISLAMGMHPVLWTRIDQMTTFNSDDFNIQSGLTPVGKVLENWEVILQNVSTRSNGFIVLEHDLFQQSVQVATGYIIPDALARDPKFSIKPVVSCLNQPMEMAYVETNDNSTNPPAQSDATAFTTSDGSPGATNTPGGAASVKLSLNAAIIAATIGGLLAGAAIVF